MIISGGSRSNWRFFSKHLMKAEENERVEVADIRGLLAGDVREAFREMDAVASGTRCRNFFYHANINPREGETLTPEQWEHATDTLERNLGLTGHARFSVEHEKEGRVHRHVVWCRINPDTMTAVSDSFTARAHEQTSRELEQAFGLEPVESVLVKDRETERPERRPRNWETYRGHGSGIDPAEVKAEVTALWNAADSGQAFAAALTEHGYFLCKGDRRDFCIIDAAGNEHSLARRIDGHKAAAIRARMADVDRDELPSVAEGRLLAADRGGREGRAGEEAVPLPPAEPAVTALPAGPAPIASPQAHPEEAQAQETNSGIWQRMAEYSALAVQMMQDERSGHAWAVEDIRGLLLSGPAAEGREEVAPQTIDGYATPLEEAIRNDGAIPTGDGLTWWQRAGYAIGEAVETAVTWARDRWHNFVESTERDPDNEPEGPDPGR